MPAFLRFKNSAARAGRMVNRKQVTMQIIQSFHRKRLQYLFTLCLLVPVAMGIARADSATSSATTPAQPAATTRSASAKTASTSSGSAQAASPAQPSAPGLNQNPPPVPTPQSPAEASLLQSQVTQTPTIEVTVPTRDTQPIETTATTTTVLTHQFLDDNKFVFLPDALESVPGLTIVAQGPPGLTTTISTHGLATDQTLLTVDGRRQSSGLYSSMDDLTNLTLDNVDQIEVVRTPIASVQGGGAMGGAVNIVTLSGRGLSTPEGSVSEEAGSFDSFRESAQSRGAVGNFDYAVAGSRQDSIYPALSTGGSFGAPGFAGQADQYRNSTYRGNFGYQVTPDVYLDLHTAYNNAYTSATGPFASPDPTANLLIEDWFLSPEVVAKVNDFYSTKLYYTHDQQRQAYNDPYNFALYGGQGNITRTQINTDSVDWQNDFDITRNWQVTAGLQGDNRNYYQFDNGLDMDDFDGHNNNIGGYLSSQWQPVTGLNVLNSGRFDNYSQFGGAFTWREAVAYTVAPTKTVLHASVARAFTPPPLQDLYLSYPAFGYYANPNLVPETDLGWEAGVEQPIWDGRVTPSFTYFHNNIKNDIANVPIDTLGDVMLENVNHATTDGVEVGLALKPWSTVTATLNYTYLNAINDTTQARLILEPRNTFNFTGTWQPIEPLTLTLGGDWVVGREDPTGVNTPDYFVLRSTATYRINKYVSLWIRGENLTDRNYQESPGYYAPSIAGYGGIKISF